MSRRVTRSAARLAADSPSTVSDTPSTALHDPSALPSSSRRPTPSRKRKVSQADLQSPIDTSFDPAASLLRRKKYKPDSTTPDRISQTAVVTAPLSRRSRRSATIVPATMSSGTQPGDKGHRKSSLRAAQDHSPPEDHSQDLHSAAARRRSSRKKSTSASQGPSAAGKRSRKAQAKKEHDLQAGGDDRNSPNSGEDDDKILGDDQDGQDGHDDEDESPSHNDHMDEDDPFGRSLFGRSGLPSGLSNTLRALSGMMSGTTTRFRGILENLRAKHDPSAQMVALSELSEVLLVSNEDNLAGYFSPSHFVKELVPLMQGNEFEEQNLEVQLLACRCIANLIEALPSATAAVVYGGAVPVLCQKLLEISYIDLAEQALVTLQKISVEFPTSIVRDGGLTACLSYLDFFATSTQRTAVTTAANCCRNIPQDSFSVVRDVMPILIGVLASNDQKVVEQGSLCVCRIVESFKHQDSKLEEIISTDLLKAVLGLLLPGTTNLIGPSIHTQFIRLLATVARASPQLSADLLKMNIVDALYQMLTSVSPPTDTNDVAGKIDKTVIMQALIRTSKHQIYETLDVICELLPGVQLTDSVVLDADEARTVSRIETAGGVRTSMESSNKRRIEVLEACKPELERFAMVLFPTLMHAYTSTVNLNVRQKTLVAQLRMLFNLDVKVIDTALRNVPYASHLAAILSQQDDPSLSILALQAAELLLKRLSEAYRHRFYREGVITETSKLARRTLKLPVRPHGAVRAPPTDDNAGEVVNEAVADASVASETQEDDIEHAGIGVDEDMDEDDRTEDESDMGDDHSLSQAVEDTVTCSAQRFMATYGNDGDSEVAKETKHIVDDLGDIALHLTECYKGSDYSQAPKLFTRLAGHFSDDALTGISSYELLISGIVDCLLQIFSNTDQTASSAARRDFAQIFMRKAEGSEASSRFAVMVNKLQDLLSRTEHFEVLTVHQNASEHNRDSAASVLSKQLRLKLTADDESGIPQTFRQIMVSIHAIATFKALDEYLRPRISACMSAPTSRRDQTTLGLGTLDVETRASADKTDGAPSTPKPKDATNDLQGAQPTAGLRRSSRRLSGHKSGDAASGDVSPLQDSPPTLECADEKQMTDEDETAEDGEHDENEDNEMDEDEAMDAVMEELDDEDLAAPEEEEPSAVNLEVANTGKVTARKEDGTRVSTPQSSQTSALAQLSASARLAAARDYLTRPGATHNTMSFAAALGAATPEDWHIEFSVDGQPISCGTTIYRAVHMGQVDGDKDLGRHVWSALHTIKFRKVAGPPVQASTEALPTMCSIDRSSENGIPTSLAKHPKTASILTLMGILHSINNHLEDIMPVGVQPSELHVEPLTRFVNSKLTAKLNRQLEEPLIVASDCLPSWAEDLARQYHFIFPFETRHSFLQATSFGYARSMAKWESGRASGSESRRHRDTSAFLARTQRQKVRISRSRILESALKVMEMYGSSPSILEVEYFEEVGTGLGPTLEFYSIVSKEFSKKKLRLWRENDSDANSEYAFGKRGLFPAPMMPSYGETEKGQRILHVFKMLGKFVARSMLDSRMIDVAFNPTLFRVAAGHVSTKPSLGSVASVDADLAKSLKGLAQAASEKQLIEEDIALSAAQKAEASDRITVNGAKIEDLALDFTLPGHSTIELVDNGANINVTIENVGLYVDKVINFTLREGVQKQVDAFKAGFSLVFPYKALESFTSAELAMLFGPGEEDWSLEALMDSIKADHGYNLDSATVRNLLQVMSQYNPEERREFLQFVTGSPKLPIGGFKSLTPRFTVVCKPSEAPLTSDDYLPSVMTCVNYLKLPNYSSMEALRAKLGVAVKEGQGAFHLS